MAYIYRATCLESGESDPEGTERLQVRRVEWDEAWGMLQRGEITDSMSVIALLARGDPAGGRRFQPVRDRTVRVIAA